MVRSQVDDNKDRIENYCSLLFATVPMISIFIQLLSCVWLAPEPSESLKIKEDSVWFGNQKLDDLGRDGVFREVRRLVDPLDVGRRTLDVVKIVPDAPIRLIAPTLDALFQVAPTPIFVEGSESLSLSLFASEYPIGKEVPCVLQVVVVTPKHEASWEISAVEPGWTTINSLSYLKERGRFLGCDSEPRPRPDRCSRVAVFATSDVRWAKVAPVLRGIQRVDFLPALVGVQEGAIDLAASCPVKK